MEKYGTEICKLLKFQDAKGVHKGTHSSETFGAKTAQLSP